MYPDGTSPHGEGGWYVTENHDVERMLIPPLLRFPEQRLTRAQALKGMTLDAAYASFSENDLGSLTPGKKSDFVVLDRDIMTIPFVEILGTKVTATIIDGKILYGKI